MAGAAWRALDVPWCSGMLDKFWAAAYIWNTKEHQWAFMALYTASLKQNPGRQAWLVEFRHPLKMDSRDRPGRKVRKGLGTDADQAAAVVAELNELLADDSLWSLGARHEAAKHFSVVTLDIFYGELEPPQQDARLLRDRLLPLPSREGGYAKVALLGVPGAGKTTLLRQFLGTHPKKEAFPSTSPNRTTTFPTEIVIQEGAYQAAVTFLSEHEARFELEETLAAAVLEAVEGDDAAVARALLEKSDMRFRLKYLFGDLQQSDDQDDPYAELSDSDLESEGSLVAMTDMDRVQAQELIRASVARIRTIAAQRRAEVEASLGPLDQLSAGDKNSAFDSIEVRAAESDEFLELLSELLEEIKLKFDALNVGGKYERTNTGWPRAWSITAPIAERSSFLAALRAFSGVHPSLWGRVVTPLVNGLRAKGPFKPEWTTQVPRLVIMDTEGLGHKANATADLTEQTASLMHEADVILLVDNAKNGMTNYAAGRALESVANSGLTRKLSMVFTHMDLAAESGLRGARLTDQILNGVRNVVDNQLAEAVPPEAARYLLGRVQQNVFYLGRLDKAEAKGAEPELNKLLTHLMAAQPEVVKPHAYPIYDRAFLMMALQEAARDFRRQWAGILGISSDSEFKPRSWQTIKALARRYAENWDDGFELRPTANLRTALETAVSRFLENPVRWSIEPDADYKREAIEHLKMAVTSRLPEVVRRRIREQPQQAWQEAWLPRGAGSTVTRRIRIDGIYQQQVPIPDARGDQSVLQFMEDIEQVVQRALDQFKEQAETHTSEIT